MLGDSEVYLNLLFKLFIYLVQFQQAGPSLLVCDFNESLILENLHYYFGLLWCHCGSLLLPLGVMEDVFPGRAHWGSHCGRGDSQPCRDMWLPRPHACCGCVPLDDSVCQPQYLLKGVVYPRLPQFIVGWAAKSSPLPVVSESLMSEEFLFYLQN